MVDSRRAVSRRKTASNAPTGSLKSKKSPRHSSGLLLRSHDHNPVKHHLSPLLVALGVVVSSKDKPHHSDMRNRPCEIKRYNGGKCANGNRGRYIITQGLGLTKHAIYICQDCYWSKVATSH